ncbi:unnamed protein product, partial [Ectocarpus sp. 12 AP-2014]
MKHVFLNAVAAASAFALTAVPAAAQSTSWWSSRWGSWGRTRDDHVTSSRVPEIDASTGLLAMAAVGAALLLAWEI